MIVLFTFKFITWLIMSAWLLYKVFFCLGDIDGSLNSLDQESPKLIEAIKRRMFAPDLNVPYNFPVKDEGALMVSGQYGQVSEIRI